MPHIPDRLTAESGVRSAERPERRGRAHHSDHTHLSATPDSARSVPPPRPAPPPAVHVQRLVEARERGLEACGTCAKPPRVHAVARKVFKGGQRPARARAAARQALRARRRAKEVRPVRGVEARAPFLGFTRFRPKLNPCQPPVRQLLFLPMQRMSLTLGACRAPRSCRARAARLQVVGRPFALTLSARLRRLLVRPGGRLRTCGHGGGSSQVAPARPRWRRVPPAVLD